MTGNIVLRVAAKVLLPAILLYALYVQAHGDLSPGGGFQAGVIFGAGFILYAIVFGLRVCHKVAPPRLVTILVAVGVMIYAGIGYLGLLLGGNYLDYNVLAHDPAHGQHYGIFFVEVGVGITVSATMLAIYYSFAGRGRPE
jgi:multicomponent Na+:H+ antiporter subunit B